MSLNYSVTEFLSSVLIILLFATFPIMISKGWLYERTHQRLHRIWKLKMPYGLYFDLKKFGGLHVVYMLNS